MKKLKLKRILKFLKTQPDDRRWSLLDTCNWVTSTMTKQLLGVDFASSSWDSVFLKSTHDGKERDLYEKTIRIPRDYRTILRPICIGSRCLFDNNPRTNSNKEIINAIESFMDKRKIDRRKKKRLDS